MGSKEVYSHYLLEVKRDYTKQLCNLLVPVMYEGILSLYTSAKNARKDVPMKMFQLVLSKVPEWNQHTITTEYNRIITKTNCEWINELITAVFISHAKILSSIKTKKKTKTLNLKIPNGDYFIHKAYIECARQFWKNPYLLYDEVNSIEYQRKLRDSEQIIEQCVEETIRKLLPIRNILQQYIAVDEESSSSSSSDEEVQEQSNKNRESKTDINDNYNEEYITQTISEKGKRKLEQSVKKTLKTSVKTEDDDKFSNYSISHELPIKKKRNIENHNSGIVNIISSTSNNNEKDGDIVNNIENINELNITNLEGGLYESLDPSNSIEISLNNKKSIKSHDKSIDLDAGSIQLDAGSMQLDAGSMQLDAGSIQLDKHDIVNIKKENLSHKDILIDVETKNLETKQNHRRTYKKSNDIILEKPHSLYEDIVLNFENENPIDKRSEKDFMSNQSNIPNSLHEDILLNWQNQNDKLSDKKSDKGLISGENEFTPSFHEDIILNWETDDQHVKNTDKRSDKVSNLSDKSENIQNLGGALLSDKKSKSKFNENNNLNLSNKSDNIKTKTKDNQKTNIEIVDYIKKTNFDSDSVFNLSMDFDIKDPKTFITSNCSEIQKMPLSLNIDEKDIQDCVENINLNTKNIIINQPLNPGNEEPPRKNSLKRRNEKKSYSFF